VLTGWAHTCRAVWNVALEQRRFLWTQRRRTLRAVAQCYLTQARAELDWLPRTFHNYFASKEEAILAAFREHFRGLMDQIRARPPEEPIWDVLKDIALSQASGAAGDPHEALARVRVLESPALLVHHLGLFDELERMSAEAIAKRTGTDVEVDLYPHLLSAATAAAMKTAVTLWERDRTGAALADLVADAFTQLRAGLPQPHR